VAVLLGKSNVMLPRIATTRFQNNYEISKAVSNKLHLQNTLGVFTKQNTLYSLMYNIRICNFTMHYKMKQIYKFSKEFYNN